MFKTIGNIIFGDSRKLELIQIASGQLFHARPKGKKNTQECIFNDSQATIRRTETDFQYQLVISRIFEEGEEELEDAEIDDEKVFLIDEVLEFHRGTFDGEDMFIWIDPSRNDAFYQYVPDSKTTLYTTNTFEQTIYRCMYERKYRKSYDNASAEDILEFQRDSLGALKKSSIGTSPGKEKSSHVSGNTGDSLPSVQNIPNSQGVVASITAELHLFNSVQGQFLLQASDIKADIVKVGQYQYWLSVSDQEQAYIGQPLEPRMNPVFNNEHHSFIWNYYDEVGTYSWLLRFLDNKSENSFRNTFAQCMYETLNQQVFSKQNKEEQDYVINAFQEDVEMGEASETDEGEDETDEDEEEDEDEVLTESSDKSKNSQLAVGYKHDRSFVVRGNKIGVFKHTEDERLEFATTINDIKTLKGKDFSPRKIMLHQEDSSMLMMDPNNEHSLYKMDLEVGKVVEEWKIHDIVPISNIVPDTKYAQMSQQQTLIGMSHNSLFRIDPRVSGFKLVEGERKQYSTKNDFSAAATTEKGGIAVASNKGDIRLFDKLGKNAKTALPALGDPIIGIDVTADGRWVLATCKNYLLLIDTEIKDGERRLGFEKSFPKDKKPIPKRLQLRPEHVAYMGQAISFTPARFNTGATDGEKTIVTSTGPYVITWNFRRVKRGRMNDYQIKRYADNVVADNFKYGQDRAIVVALPHDVTMATKKHLHVPTKEALTTPTAKLRSRSNIVNSPY